LLLELLLLVEHQELLAFHEEGVGHAVKLEGDQQGHPLDHRESAILG
jgi:hypothetical protein